MFKEIPLNGEELPKKQISTNDILRYRILPSDEIPKPDAVLFFDDVMVMSRQNISCVTGKAKVGKTFLMTLINEAILHKGEFQNKLRSYLPKGKDKIIYIDTEQSKYHISLILKRIQRVINDEKLDNVLMFNFDALGTEMRREYVEHLIYNIEGVGVVIIDGISDLVYDPNDIRESSVMADDLRKWATERDLHIINVLHQNPSASEKMRGHLGTILTNKSETVIQISGAKDDESVKLVETLATRNKKPENWSFEIIDGNPQIQGECYEVPTVGRPKAKVLADYQKYALLTSIFSKTPADVGYGYAVLTEKLQEEYKSVWGQIGANSMKELVKYCREMNWIVNEGKGKNYFLYPFKETVL